MITNTEVKLGEYLGTLKLLEKLIDVGKWVLVLYCLLVPWAIVKVGPCHPSSRQKEHHNPMEKNLVGSDPYALVYRVVSSAPSTLLVQACKDICKQVPCQAQDQ